MNNFKVAVLISGNGSNLQALIDNFQKEEDPVKITCVISNKKEDLTDEDEIPHFIEKKIKSA